MQWEEYLSERVHHNLFIKAQVYKPTIQLMRRVLRPGEPVIELGSGSGRTAKLMADMGYPTTAVDLAYPLLKPLNAGSDLFGDLKTVNADMANLPFPDKSFKLAYSFQVLEHFDADTIVAFLREQKRIADFVVVDVPNDKCEHQSFGDENFYSDEQWTDMFTQAGLDVQISFQRGLDRGQRVDNCSVFLANDMDSPVELQEITDVYDHY